MRARTWLTAIALSTAAVALNQTPLPPINPWPGELPCEAGQLQLAWDLPAGGQTSVAVGVANLAQNTPLYAVDMTLTDVQTPCLSCISGTIVGTLDDGVGAGPDYILRGTYGGVFLSGTGRFRGAIFDPVTNTRVGNFSGEFADPPSTPQVGVAAGPWVLCD